MGDYEISVMGTETYTIRGAESEEDAIDEAITCFMNDDLYWGTEEADKVTEADCEIVWFEEY